MKYNYVFAVKDINVARKFYEELFGLVVVDDFGRNIAFESGLSLQQDFDWLTGIPKNEMKDKENNCEIYFEAENFSEFLGRLKKRDDITLLHDVVMHSWGQRVIRFYDLDNHLIEVGEAMKAVVVKFQQKGMSIKEIAGAMDVAEGDVLKMLEKG